MTHRLIRPAGRTKTALLPPFFSHGSETLALEQHFRPLLYQSALGNLNSLLQQTRGYMSEMRKSAFEGNILRLLRNEIEYELDRSPSPQPVPTFNSFVVDERPGQQWISLSKKFGYDEVIKVEVTMFDGNAPIRQKRGIGTGDDVDLFISMVVQFRKGKGSDILEFECSTWSDCIEIEKVFMHGENGMIARPYMGPPFLDLDDQLQESLYNFLESRGINDELAAFLHKYMQNKRRTEYIQWMGTVKSIIEKKV